MKQLRLGSDELWQVVIATEQREPAFWVKRLAVLRELAPGIKHFVRDIPLRRGLNIVWTPPHRTATPNELFESGMAGHTAGKTTFCRLIRHILGEYGLAPDRTRQRIRATFPTGWLMAEVVIGGETWAVARPLGLGLHPFCVRGTSIEGAIASPSDRSDYQEFLDALSQATVAKLPAKSFPTDETPLNWDHLLPWLTRDQECRFADFLDWRHSSSDSEAPAPNVEERQFIVRSVLGLINDKERLEQLRNTQLANERKEATSRLPVIQHKAVTDKRRLESLMGNQVEFSPSLFSEDILAILGRRQAEFEEQLAALVTASQIEQEALREQTDFALRSEQDSKRIAEEAASGLSLLRAKMKNLSGTEQERKLFIEDLSPPRGYCNQPMELARAAGCPLAATEPESLMAHRSARVAAEELEHLRQLEARVEQNVKASRIEWEEWQKRSRAARAKEMAARTESERRRGALIDARAPFLTAERLVSEADGAFREAAQLEEKVAQLTRAIEDSYKNQERLRGRNNFRLSQVSSTFDCVARAILGDNINASIEPSGRSLRLVIEHHGERESAAIETVQLLAFDLAALLENLAGRGFYPGFLIHDGPRQADLAPDIYERLFLFMLQVERCFKGEPPFQYIVTTTTPPPEQLLKDPWLRLTISGVPAEERLFRCDL